jgi:hypothetical protein
MGIVFCICFIDPSINDGFPPAGGDHETPGATKFDSKTIPDKYAMVIAEHILETDK